MSLIPRKNISIGRAERDFRDDRFFIIASEDSYAPEQYFKFLGFPRVKVVVISTPTSSCESAPNHVVERLKTAHDEARKNKQIQDGDEFWVMIDTDHHIHGTHLRSTIGSIKEARQRGFELAISNPCFELWLLLHHVDIPADTVFGKPADAETMLRKTLGGYSKTAIKAEQFPLLKVSNAIRRARALESNPDDPEGHWPPSTGTRVYRLMERIMGWRAS